MAVAAAVATTELPGPAGQLSNRNFERLARFVHEYSGIRMPPSKKTMLEGRLRRCMRETGYATLDAYCGYLFDLDGIELEAVKLIDAVTTNKTDFFREPGHFSYLSDVVLPDIAGRGQRQIRAWSSACSTGAEPYTIAMVLDEFARRSRVGYRILATDLSTHVLAAAQRGIYTSDMIDPVPEALADRYVMRAVKPGNRNVRIHPDLRAKVGFARLNLMDDRYPVGDAMDLIFCRNVLIYFDKNAQREVLNRLCDCLAVGGHLFIGHSESVAGFGLPLTQVSNTIFQKT